jgi:N6-L-threonylcarbamoyladenine synthase
MVILGIETSCDETSAAILKGKKVCSNIISSQIEHLQFGGVVPELASRAHIRKIVPIVDKALNEGKVTLDKIDGIAVTCGPGLVGALLVGVNYAKGLSLSLKKPFIGINHIEGHIYSNFLDENDLEPPFICLLVSGGHTQIVLVKKHLEYKLLGKTKDDAVGEAFDKVAKILGLSYPGGPQIDKISKIGNPNFVKFPRALIKEKSFDFSYSGLKTSVSNYIRELPEQKSKSLIANIAASFQTAAIEVLVQKTIRAARTYQCRNVAICGGVAANSLLRSWIKDEALKFHMDVYLPDLQYCGDNAAMIARAGLERLTRGEISQLDLGAYPSMQLEG